MTIQDLRDQRLHNQRLVGNQFSSPEETVRWNLAVQAQDYPGSMWGIGQRTEGVVAADLDRLFDEGAILRTHVMRPTWHFVLPEDIRWLLELTGPRVQRANAGRYRQLELDTGTLARSSDLFARSLAGGHHLTRSELAGVLEQAGISTKGQRMAHMLMNAELEGIICSGPRQGRQFTYALLEERASPGRTMERDEALAEITRRYLESHGPATPHDMAWWSGLTVTDCRRGIDMHRDSLDSVTIGKVTWWYVPTATTVEMPDPIVHLLPNFDEYYVGFRNNEVAWDPAIRARYDTGREFWVNHYVALNGSIVGGWTRRQSATDIRISTNIPAGLDDAGWQSLHGAGAAHGRFHGLPVAVDPPRSGE